MDPDPRVIWIGLTFESDSSDSIVLGTESGGKIILFYLEPYQSVWSRNQLPDPGQHSRRCNAAQYNSFVTLSFYTQRFYNLKT